MSKLASNLRADRRVGLMLAGVFLLAFVAIGATVALPATDPSLDVEPMELSAQARDGMQVFAGEGCWYCHTGYIRETLPDAVLGARGGPETFEGLSPSMLGLERTGPNISAMRGMGVDAIKAHGNAGALSHLSGPELEALAAYLLARNP